MRLYVEELRSTPLTQKITTTRTILLDRVRLHLCKFLSPAGTFKVEILDHASTVLTSTTLTLAQMQTLGSAGLQAPYYHGQVTFAFQRAITLRPDEYYVRFSATGYSFSESTYIGWAKSWPDPTVLATEDSPTVPADYPYDFELYSLQRTR